MSQSEPQIGQNPDKSDKIRTNRTKSGQNTTHPYSILISSEECQATVFAWFSSWDALPMMKAK